MIVPHAGKIWAKSYGQNYTNFWVCWQKIGFLKTIFDKALMPFFEAGVA